VTTSRTPDDTGDLSLGAEQESLVHLIKLVKNPSLEVIPCVDVRNKSRRAGMVFKLSKVIDR
jgi:hypothetical protein